MGSYEVGCVWDGEYVRWGVYGEYVRRGGECMGWGVCEE